MMVQTTQPDRTASPFVEPWEPTQRAIIITAIAVALIASLSTATFVVQRIWYTPESAVEGYFGALADRDAVKASSYLNGDGPSFAADLVGSEAYVPPTGLKVDEIVEDDDGDRRTAKVSFAIGDRRTTGEISLRREEELSFGLFRGWSVAGGRQALQVSTSTPIDVRVNGKPVETDSEQPPEIDVFPGRYVVDVADNPLVESAPVTVDVGFSDSQVDLVTRIKPAAEKDVDAQIKKYLEGCLIAATKPEHTCPFSYGYSGLLRPVWRIDKYPTVVLRLNSDGQVVAETTADGQATVTGTGYGGLPYTDTDLFTVNGAVTAEQGKITFQPE
jgi:hypothetical protein